MSPLQYELCQTHHLLFPYFWSFVCISVNGCGSPRSTYSVIKSIKKVFQEAFYQVVELGLQVNTKNQRQVKQDLKFKESFKSIQVDFFCFLE
ncbi:uncharacterized protein LOC122196887 [Lactuca sativa]|uniref:uncharacterized protein LOC122196887 n=1 Tax=Lactuca sativa TaxID=4236 RepID=UPI001C68E9BE|nr:uncharacterized protein LOC122196887 [Lactuca sativa]